MVISLDPRYKLLDGDLLITTACPVGCDFCVYSCTADCSEEKWMPEDIIRRVAEEYSSNDVGIRISGGEPFYDFKRLLKCLEILFEFYKPFEISILTSGFWATVKDTESKLHTLRELGIDSLVISTDRFHERNVPLNNIENILTVSEKIGIEAALRVTIDQRSKNFIDSVSEIITKYKTPFECHGWGPFGRAESMDQQPRINFNAMIDYFYQKIMESAKRNEAPQNIEYYLTYTPKRHQREYAPGLFPTTFPNGDTYGCSMALKGSYLGNIRNEKLSHMLERWKLTLQGHYNLGNYCTCNELDKFAAEPFPLKCNFCRNEQFPPLNRLEVGRGRKEIQVGSNEIKNTTLEKLNMNDEQELLLTIEVGKKDLTPSEGEFVSRLLEELQDKKIKVSLSKPLPRCMKVNVPQVATPKNCFECVNLFHVKNGFFHLCDAMNSEKGPALGELQDRKDVYKFFKKIRKKKKLCEPCTSCRYLLRNQCDGLCFAESGA